MTNQMWETVHQDSKAVYGTTNTTSITPSPAVVSMAMPLMMFSPAHWRTNVMSMESMSLLPLLGNTPRQIQCLIVFVSIHMICGSINQHN